MQRLLTCEGVYQIPHEIDLCIKYFPSHPSALHDARDHLTFCFSLRDALIKRGADRTCAGVIHSCMHIGTEPLLHKLFCIALTLGGLYVLSSTQLFLPLQHPRKGTQSPMGSRQEHARASSWFDLPLAAAICELQAERYEGIARLPYTATTKYCIPIGAVV